MNTEHRMKHKPIKPWDDSDAFVNKSIAGD